MMQTSTKRSCMVSTHTHLVRPHCFSVLHVHTAIPMYGKRSYSWLQPRHKIQGKVYYYIASPLPE